MEIVDSVFKSAESSIVSALFGFLAAVATFRSKFALIETRHDQLRAEIATAREFDKKIMEMTLHELRADVERNRCEVTDYNKQAARMQKVTLEILASLAMKHGVAHRALGSDGLASIIDKANNDG